MGGRVVTTTFECGGHDRVRDVLHVRLADAEPFDPPFVDLDPDDRPADIDRPHRQRQAHVALANNNQLSATTHTQRVADQEIAERDAAVRVATEAHPETHPNSDLSRDPRCDTAQSWQHRE